MILGLRPEDFHDRKFTPPLAFTQPFRAKVDVTELVGNEIILYLVSGGNTFVARVDPRSNAQIGQEIPCAVNMENMHIFHPDTKEAVL
jgi:multiple sugar transport system ATP-binding protein